MRKTIVHPTQCCLFWAKKALFGAFSIVLGAAPCVLRAQRPVNLDSMRRVADTATVEKVRIYALETVGVGLAKTNRDSAQKIADYILRLAEEKNADRLRYVGSNVLARIAMYAGDYQRGLELYQKAFGYGEKNMNKSELAAIHHNIANALFYLSRYQESVTAEMKALPLYVELHDSSGIASCYNSWGLALSRLKRFNESVYYQHKALEINLLTKKNPYFTYSRLGEAYYGANKLDSSNMYHEKALEAAQQAKNQLGIAICQSNIAINLAKMGQPARAKPLFGEAIAYFESKNERHFRPIVISQLAKAEVDLGEHAAALKHTEEALALSKDLGNHEVLTVIFEARSQAYAAIGDFEKAYQASLQHQVHKDSLVAAERSAEVAQTEAQFRTSEQKQVIVEQNLQLERQRNRNQLYLGAALLLLFLGGALAFYLREKRRRAELNLRLEHAEAARLRDLDKVKSAFFANISHEFRTPLTLLLGPLQEMEAGTFRGNAQKYFGIMRRNAARLLQLVNQLLDLSRLESGKLRLATAPGDLHRLLRAVAGSFESMADQKQIDFRISIPAETFWVNFDADKIEKIAANLLSNAFKFTPEEGSVRFEVKSDTGSGALELRVSDTGIGIPAQHIGHIFDRFYQIENTQSEFQPGSGIGLALTKELVELQGGRITAESIENQGATFAAHFVFEKAEPTEKGHATTDVFSENDDLPGAAIFEKSASNPIAPEAMPLSASGKKAAQSAPQILVVEDNADVRNYVVEHLKGQFKIAEAENGQKALEMAGQTLPDLIITDLMMPEMDGMELARRLKSDVNTSHIPLIMLTAKADREDRLEGIGSGAEMYMTKPFDPEELRLVVAKMLEQRRILQEKYGREIRLGAGPAPAEPSIDDLFLQKVLATIEENLDDETFGVENLASAVAMSRSNLFRKLDSLLGKSPNALIRERRLQRGKELLQQGVGNVTEVAFRVGFNSANYFSTCFREMFGVAPGEIGRT